MDMTEKFQALVRIPLVLLEAPALNISHYTPEKELWKIRRIE
jgi:hypothetical protein